MNDIIIKFSESNIGTNNKGMNKPGITVIHGDKSASGLSPELAKQIVCHLIDMASVMEVMKTDDQHEADRTD